LKSLLFTGWSKISFSRLNRRCFYRWKTEKTALLEFFTGFFKNIKKTARPSYFNIKP